MRLVVDASVGLKWVLAEHDSPWALALADREPDLVVPDFWLNEAVNVLWVNVRRKAISPDKARWAVDRLRHIIPPTPTSQMRLQELALQLGASIDHSPYDTLYLAFALAVGAAHVILCDREFEAKVRLHPDPGIARLALPLADWAAQNNLNSTGTAGG